MSSLHLPGNGSLSPGGLHDIDLFNTLGNELVPIGAKTSKHVNSVAHAISMHFHSIDPLGTPNRLRGINWAWAQDSEMVARMFQ